MSTRRDITLCHMSGKLIQKWVDGFNTHFGEVLEWRTCPEGIVATVEYKDETAMNAFALLSTGAR